MTPRTAADRSSRTTPAPNVRGIVPALLGPRRGTHAARLDAASRSPHADQVVLLVLDGLGWEQLQAAPRPDADARRRWPVGPITTVAPTTTATALTSIATGLTPASTVSSATASMSAARCSTCCAGAPAATRRRSHPPPRRAAVRPVPRRRRRRSSATVELERSAFTEAHLRGCGPVGWRAASAIAVEVGRLLQAGERFVYAYYDGIDKIAHERGFGEYYDAEVARRRSAGRRHAASAPARRGAAGHRRPRPGRGRPTHRPARPPRCWRMVTHAVGRGPVPLAARQPGAAPTCWPRRRPSARGRRPGSVTREQVLDERLVRTDGRARRSRPPRRRGRSWPTQPVSFHDPADTGPFELVCRHGSLTSAEMLVPLLGRATLTTLRTSAHDRRSDHHRRPASATDAGRAPASSIDRAEADGRGARTPGESVTTGQGDAHRLDGQAAARGGPRRPRSTRPAASGWPRSTSARSPSCPRRCRPTCRRSCASLALPFSDGEVPTEGELRDRQGPARRLARGPLPRHPGHAVRPAAGRPPAARADAPAAAGRDAAVRPGTGAAAARPPRHLPADPRPAVGSARTTPL